MKKSVFFIIISVLVVGGVIFWQSRSEEGTISPNDGEEIEQTSELQGSIKTKTQGEVEEKETGVVTAKKEEEKLTPIVTTVPSLPVVGSSVMPARK